MLAGAGHAIEPWSDFCHGPTDVLDPADYPRRRDVVRPRGPGSIWNPICRK